MRTTMKKTSMCSVLISTRGVLMMNLHEIYERHSRTEQMSCCVEKAEPPVLMGWLSWALHGLGSSLTQVAGILNQPQDVFSMC